MNQSVMASLKAAQELEHKPNRPADGDRTPVRICVCGHREADHGEAIGGSFAPTFFSAGRVHSREIRLSGCCGEPLPHEVKKHNNKRNWRDTEETVPHPIKAEFDILVAERIATCPCEKFRPVLVVNGGRQRFNQWRPVDPPRSGQRDRNPAHHALMRGIKAMVTEIRNRLVRGETPEDEVEDRTAELLADRIQWLPDGQRCWTRHCAQTVDVLPTYLDGDLSEMRCPAHRP